MKKVVVDIFLEFSIQLRAYSERGRRQEVSVAPGEREGEGRDLRFLFYIFSI